jgi:hypothetical protein
MRALMLAVTVRRAGCAAALAIVAAAVGCTGGTTPDDCDAGDASPCGTFTPIPDATLDTAAPDAGEDSGDAEEEGVVSSPPDAGIDGAAADGAAADGAGSEAGDGGGASPADGSADGHVLDGGHD